MKKEYKYISAIIILLIGMLWLKDPIQVFLHQFSREQDINRLISKVIDHFFIIGIFLLVMKRLGLNRFNGIGKNTRIRDREVLVVPTVLILIGLVVNWSIYSSAKRPIFILFIFSVFSTGLAEELCFRGLVLPLFVRSKRDKQYTLYVSVLLSAFLFGLLHYGNLIKDPGNFWGITSQVFMGFSVGVFLGALMLRTGNIIIVGICHGFINFIFGNKIIEQRSFKQAIKHYPNELNQDLISFVVTGFIFVIIIVIGINMIRKVDKNKIRFEMYY